MSSRQVFVSLPMVFSAMVVVSCSGGTENTTAPADSNRIMVGIHLHVDPVGTYVGPTRELRIAEYDTHREAIAWLKQLCRDKGCKISAQMTGVYAEFVNKLSHFDDFADFMPGKTHHLGVHLHNQYKDSSGDTSDFTWSEATLGTSALATQVWNDEVPLVNHIFEHFGYSATDNNEWDAAQAMCEDMMVCLGLQPGAGYANQFTIVGGSRDYYHPYRWDPDHLQMTTDTLQNGPTVAVSLGIEGVFGVNGEHGPDGWLNGTLEFAQRDYVMEYIEWLYSKTWDTTSRPWVFEASFHPYNILAGVTDPKGRLVRDTLVSLYDWLNSQFEDTLSYANRADVVATYESWQQANPNELIFVDSDTSTPAIEPRMFNSTMRTLLKTNSMYLSNSDRSGDPEIFEFTNTAGKKAVLAIAKAKGAHLELADYLSGSINKIRMGETATSMNTTPASVELDLVPTMFTDATAIEPSCGDGVCDAFERRSGMCPVDCQ
jgi:hypothetical protein